VWMIIWDQRNKPMTSRSSYFVSLLNNSLLRKQASGQTESREDYSPASERLSRTHSM
jgi:hypothetical protein